MQQIMNYLYWLCTWGVYWYQPFSKGGVTVPGFVYLVVWFCHIMEDYDREWLSTALWLRRDLFKGDQKSRFVKWCTCSTSCVPGSPCLSTWKCHPVTFWNAVFQQNSVLALLAEHCSEIDVGQHEIEQLLCYIADATTLCSDTSRFISVVVLDSF